MRYMVMECHLSYAVVLDEEGRFLKVANRHYEVGQTVYEVIEMKRADLEKDLQKKSYRWIYSLGALAACLLFAFTAIFQMQNRIYGSVYMQINPSFRVDVNRKDVVVGLEGLNADGVKLITDYVYKRKPLNQVMDEIVDRAIEGGYLHQGSVITLHLDADDDDWRRDKEEMINRHLKEYLSEKLDVKIPMDSPDVSPQQREIIIPLAPQREDEDTDDDLSDDQEEELPSDRVSDYEVQEQEQDELKENDPDDDLPISQNAPPEDDDEIEDDDDHEDRDDDDDD